MPENRLFEFTTAYMDEPEVYDGIEVYQFGETCLEAGARIQEHTQRCHELSLVLSGESVFSGDGVRVKCVPGDIHMIAKGIKHEITAGAQSEMRYIHFGFGFCGDASAEYDKLFSECKNVIVRDRLNIRALAVMLVNEYYNNYPDCAQAKCSLVKLMIINMCRTLRLQQGEYMPDKTDSNTVYRIIRYIEENNAVGVSVSGIAEMFSYSSSYISHLFKKRTGMSLREYIMTVRLEYAEQLLSDKKSSLTEVVNLCGYDSAQSFCRIFKKYKGVAPGGFTASQSRNDGIRNADEMLSGGI